MDKSRLIENMNDLLTRVLQKTYEDDLVLVEYNVIDNGDRVELLPYENPYIVEFKTYILFGPNNNHFLPVYDMSIVGEDNNSTVSIFHNQLYEDLHMSDKMKWLIREDEDNVLYQHTPYDIVVDVSLLLEYLEKLLDNDGELLNILLV